MTTLRLIADDLTGALDAAAEFVGLTGPVHAFWQDARPDPLPANAALDLGTREAGPVTARNATIAALPALARADIAFKKIDSLMRGQTLLELAACFTAGSWDRAVLAPAFPFQGRVTRHGQQFAQFENRWTPVGPDLVEALRALGVPAQPATPGAALPRGITVFNADTDAELDEAVARAGGAGAPVLWCGTGGLARALAGDGAPAAVPALPGPILGLFGSDQAATAAQLAACDPHWIALLDGDAGSAARLVSGLDRHGIALATHDLPAGVSRAEAAERIDLVFRALVHRLPPPGTLVVAGGETLRGLCLALRATSLEVRGRALPGVPVSILRGGAWDGVTVFSKSGAFGHPTLLRDLLRIPEFERTAR